MWPKHKSGIKWDFLCPVTQMTQVYLADIRLHNNAPFVSFPLLRVGTHRTVIPIFLMAMNYPFIIPLYWIPASIRWLVDFSYSQLCRVVLRSFASEILMRQKWMNVFSFSYYRFHTTHHPHYSPPRFLPHFIARGSGELHAVSSLGVFTQQRKKAC